MSYLSLPRLSFAGRFMSDVSTINNEIGNYDGTVEERSWNPIGSASFEFEGCRVQGGATAAGPIAAGDPALALAIIGAPGRTAAKMVDLDPDCQWASQIWGLAVRAIDPASGELAFSGEFAVASFRDMWTRQVDKAALNGQPAAGRYVSRLRHLAWGPVADRSPLLSALRASAGAGELAIGIHVFGYYYTVEHPRHTTGSLVGTIGPVGPKDPVTALAGRRLLPLGQALGPVDFEVDEAGRRLHCDLGHALPIDGPDGGFADFGRLVRRPGAREFVLGLAGPGEMRPLSEHPAGSVGELGSINPFTPGWYAETGGVATLTLDDEQLARIAGARLALYLRLPSGALAALTAETKDGLFARADPFALRLDPDDVEEVAIHVRRYGKPIAGHRIALEAAGDGSALDYPDSVESDANGVARVRVRALDPGPPSRPADGVVQSFAYAPAGDPGAPDPTGLGLGRFDQIVAHVRERFEADEHPNWDRDIRPILAQYAQVYPVMTHHVFDLADKEAVLRRRQAMLLAFSRDIADPNYMPVTRDLSKAKRAAIVRWLEQATEPVLEAEAQTKAPVPADLAVAPGEDVKATLAERLGTSYGLSLPDEK